MNKKKVWFWLMSISSCIYMGWRLFFTLPIDAGIVALIAGICLFAAELISVIEAMINFVCMSKDEEPELPVIAREDYPDVDVLIATHSEETELLLKTVNGCKHMKYVDKAKVHIYLCDDGNRSSVARLAREMEVGYLPLAENKEAKAGNLNHALSKTNSPLVLTLDADMIPKSNFLMETVPYFLLPEMIKEDGAWRKRTEEEKDPAYKIGFVQTPQSFYNPDLFQFNFFAESNIPNEQDYFFRRVNVGRNSSNSAIYAGSNTLIARKALEECGGLRTHTITEDFATGIDIQEKGYACYAIKKVLASGLAPNDFPNLLKQRQRWGRGCVQTIRSMKFWTGKLPVLSKLSYFSCLLYWWTFIRRIIFILSPIFYSVFGILVVKANLWGIALIWLPYYLIYNHSLKVLSGKIRDQKWSNIVDTILCPYMIIPILLETFGIRMKKFAVTQKEKTVTKSAKVIYAVPHIILLAATVIGVVFIVNQMIAEKNMFSIVVLFWLCMNGYFLVMAVLFMLGRVNYRGSERFFARIPIKIHTKTAVIEGFTSDISEYGLAFNLDFPEYINDICMFELQDGDWSARVKGQVIQVSQVNNSWKYSIQLEELTLKEKEEYYQIVYDRQPTLATEIKTNAWKDLLIFYKRKTAAFMRLNRKMPRIFLNCEIKTEEGRPIMVRDYNYQYISIFDEVPEEGLGIKIGKVRLWIKPSQDEFLRSKRLYEIENWKEISGSVELREALTELISAQKEK